VIEGIFWGRTSSKAVECPQLVNLLNYAVIQEKLLRDLTRHDSAEYSELSTFQDLGTVFWYREEVIHIQFDKLGTA
jgi:hypothetical protein